MKNYITFLITLFGCLETFPNNDLNYLTKSYRLEKIGKILEKKKKFSQTEYFALLKYHENHPKGKEEKILKILTSIVLSKDIKETDKKILNQLTHFSIKKDNEIFRTSFWKLYNQLVKKKIIIKGSINSISKKPATKSRSYFS